MNSIRILWNICTISANRYCQNPTELTLKDLKGITVKKTKQKTVYNAVLMCKCLCIKFTFPDVINTIPRRVKSP